VTSKNIVMQQETITGEPVVTSYYILLKSSLLYTKQAGNDAETYKNKNAGQMPGVIVCVKPVSLIEEIPTEYQLLTFDRGIIVIIPRLIRTVIVVIVRRLQNIVVITILIIVVVIVVCRLQNIVIVTIRLIIVVIVVVRRLENIIVATIRFIRVGVVIVLAGLYQVGAVV